MIRFLMASLAFLPALALAAGPTPVAQQEIAQLTRHLRESSCQFNRNGSWYDAQQAADHLQRKYEALAKRGLVATAEDFIARAGTESSTTGTPYQVRCGSAPARDSGPWLRAELERLRAARR